jgi:hypothetical protein
VHWAIVLKLDDVLLPNGGASLQVPGANTFDAATLGSGAANNATTIAAQSALAVQVLVKGLMLCLPLRRIDGKRSGLPKLACVSA